MITPPVTDLVEYGSSKGSSVSRRAPVAMSTSVQPLTFPLSSQPSSGCPANRGPVVVVVVLAVVVVSRVVVERGRVVVGPSVRVRLLIGGGRVVVIAAEGEAGDQKADDRTSDQQDLDAPAPWSPGPAVSDTCCSEVIG